MLQTSYKEGLYKAYFQSIIAFLLTYVLVSLVYISVSGSSKLFLTVSLNNIYQIR